MYRIFCILICTLCIAGAPLVSAQRDYPEVEKPKPKAKVVKPRPPRGAQTAQNRGNGVLFVLTEPPVAEVTIKARGATVKQGRRGDGVIDLAQVHAASTVQTTITSDPLFRIRSVVA